MATAIAGGRHADHDRRTPRAYAHAPEAATNDFVSCKQDIVRANRKVVRIEAGNPRELAALEPRDWQGACVSLVIMADDNVEGQEVDLLIQELSSEKPIAGKPATAAAAVVAPAPARSTTRAVAPPVGVGSRTFVSAISVQTPADEGGIKERAVEWLKEHVADSIKERFRLPSRTTGTTSR